MEKREGCATMKRTILSIRGFTLVEAIVVMAVFSFVLLITASAFKTILTKTRVVFGSEQSNIEGVVGLEMLRHDLQQAGFGLFSDEDSAPDFAEAANAPYSDYNDANGVPRAVVTDNNLDLGNNATVLASTDILVIKGTTVSTAGASQRWSYITDTGVPKRWGTEDFRNGTDKLIAMEQYYDKKKDQVFRKLVRVNPNNYAFSYYSTSSFTDMEGSATSEFIPPPGRRHYLYGITGGTSGGFNLRAPFNRADYIVQRRDTTPASCSPAAGTLYKMTMNQSDGRFTWIPVLDCVADMQVVLGWNTTNDPDNSQEVSVLSNADGTRYEGEANGMSIQSLMSSAEEVRRRLRLIRVYLLVQDGYRDLNFTNTDNAMVVGNPELGETELTNTVDLTTEDMRNYRWKLYWVVVRPKNLQ